MDSGMPERQARIFNIQKYSIYDGPGIRTLVFFKGCPLRCQWCANPEGLEKKYQVMYQRDLCNDCGACVAACPRGIHRVDTSGSQEPSKPQHVVDRKIECMGCRECEKVCPARALSIVGMNMTVSEIVEIVEQDMLFYTTSGGGVTLGGGEVCAQSEFAVNLLKECKRSGIHTAIETSGHTKPEAILATAEFTDLILYDLKHMDSDRHYQLTGVRNERILENLRELITRKHNVEVRMPLMKGLNDDEETIRKTVEFLLPYKEYRNFKGIDLLPYHKLGINKYRQLDMVYAVERDLSLNEADLERIERQISQYDFPVRVIKH
ncbi:choline TMA-lyase-activating enzyme [Paenibacillus alvei]|uniref:choline TMA-lyase-activating enzyme n=1 Tax=Paenibacillus alvei TaxID=44250 RepID=UPI0003858AC3|nr:choline TMA-lyase-activating enzyme [Paenibacillus alvei]EPY11458.1 glycyl-radical enzyme activating protein family [Paenibacillus alvei A6-6i-x]